MSPVYTNGKLFYKAAKDVGKCVSSELLNPEFGAGLGLANRNSSNDVDLGARRAFGGEADRRHPQPTKGG